MEYEYTDLSIKSLPHFYYTAFGLHNKE